MLEREFLSENRKYKTLSSIPKVSDGHIVFKSYLQIEEIMFSKISKNSENIQNFYNEIISIIEQNTAHKEHLFLYLIELLVSFISIRPKQAEIASTFLSILFLKFTNKQNLIINTINENNIYKDNSFVQKILYTQGLCAK